MYDIVNWQLILKDLICWIEKKISKEKTKESSTISYLCEYVQL